MLFQNLERYTALKQTSPLTKTTQRMEVHLTFIINETLTAKKNTLCSPAYLQTKRTCNVRKRKKAAQLVTEYTDIYMHMYTNMIFF